MFKVLRGGDNVIDFTTYKLSGRSYAGNAGAKRGIIYDGSNWLLKFPKSTKGFRNAEISYTTSPLSEYLGSKIYETLGIDVHTTLLGTYNNKIVVACKDFRKPGEDLTEFRAIKNDYIEGLEEHDGSSSDGSDTHLNSIITVMNENETFKAMPELKKRFWDMFVVDALIGNNDRNNGNWGILVDSFSHKRRIAPVYDNGAAFSGKLSDNQIEKILSDNQRFVQSIYDSRTCCFLDDDDRQINPLKFIMEGKNRDCNTALKRINPRINLDRIMQIIDELPSKYKGLTVISDSQREFYKKTLEYRYKNVFVPTMRLLRDLDKNKALQNK